MKLFVFFGVLSLALCIAYVQADCETAADTDDGNVKAWFKIASCKIQTSVGSLQETTKPWADKIGQTAKDIGSSVAHQFDDIKHKLSDDGPSTVATPVIYDAPTAKVPLAPLSGDGGGNVASSSAPFPQASATAI